MINVCWQVFALLTNESLYSQKFLALVPAKFISNTRLIVAPIRRRLPHIGTCQETYSHPHCIVKFSLKQLYIIGIFSCTSCSRVSTKKLNKSKNFSFLLPNYQLLLYPRESYSSNCKSYPASKTYHFSSRSLCFLFKIHYT